MLVTSSLFFVNLWLLYACGLFSVAKIEVFGFLISCLESMFIEVPSLLYFFLHLWGSGFTDAHGIPESVTGQCRNSEEYTKVELLNCGFASSKFPYVIILAKLFFRFTFSIVGALYTSSF